MNRIVKLFNNPLLFACDIQGTFTGYERTENEAGVSFSQQEIEIQRKKRKEAVKRLIINLIKLQKVHNCDGVIFSFVSSNKFDDRKSYVANERYDIKILNEYNEPDNTVKYRIYEFLTCIKEILTDKNLLPEVKEIIKAIKIGSSVCDLEYFIPLYDDEKNIQYFEVETHGKCSKLEALEHLLSKCVGNYVSYYADDLKMDRFIVSAKAKIMPKIKAMFVVDPHFKEIKPNHHPIEKSGIKGLNIHLEEKIKELSVLKDSKLDVSKSYKTQQGLLDLGDYK